MIQFRKKFLNKYFRCLAVIAIIHNAVCLHAMENKFSQTDYIKNLYDNEKYFQAIAEIDRYIIANNEDKQKYEYFIALNYFHGAQYKTITNDLNLFSEAKFSASHLLYLNALYNIHENEKIEEKISKLDFQNINKIYMNDLCVINTALYLDQFDFKKANITLQKYHAANENSFTIKYLNLLSDYEKLHYKSELLSASMSAVLPGSGQFYSGKYLDGVFSIVSVFGSGFLTYWLYKNDYQPQAVMTGCFTALLYSGSVFGAYNSAGNYNYHVSNSFREKILKELDYNYNPDEYLKYDELFKK